MSSYIIVQMELLNNRLTFEVNTWLLEDLPLSHTLQNILYVVFTNNKSCLQHNTEYIIKSGYVYVFTFSTNHDSGTPKKLPSIFFLHFLRCSLSKDPPAPARSSWQIENTREPIPGERTAFALFAFSWVFLHCFSFLSARKNKYGGVSNFGRDFFKERIAKREGGVKAPIS